MAPIKGGRKEALADGDMLGVSRGLSEVMGVTRLEVMAGVIWAVVGVTPTTVRLTSPDRSVPNSLQVYTPLSDEVN